MTTVRDLKYRVGGWLAGIPLSWRDGARNRRWATADRRFLVVRHAHKRTNFYDVLLEWLEEKHPAVRARFELRHLNGVMGDWGRYVLHVPWMQDPVQAWSPTAYEQCNRLAAKCDALGIPVVNRVDRLANAGKASGAELIGSVGIRTAKMARIDDAGVFYETAYGLKPPFFVRQDWGHGGPLFFVDEPEKVRQVPLKKFKRPVAVEFIDVKDPRDGLHRKYRFVAGGDFGFPASMHPCQSWFAKGTHTEFNDALREEEVEFLNRPEPNVERFQAARRALGFDFVAFDYSYDREGNLVVWEANPFPFIHFGSQKRSYRWAAVERVLAVMVQLYLTRAGLPVPGEIERHLQPALGEVPAVVVG